MDNFLKSEYCTNFSSFLLDDLPKSFLPVQSIKECEFVSIFLTFFSKVLASAME